MTLRAAPSHVQDAARRLRAHLNGAFVGWMSADDGWMLIVWLDHDEHPREFEGLAVVNRGVRTPSCGSA